MQNVGFKVLHEGARKMLKAAGAVVEDEWVRVPEFIVSECLRTVPKGWTVFDRNGDRCLEVEGRKSYYGTSTASPNTKDALTGEIHPTRVADIAVGAKVADALENIDWVMPMGSSQDVPALAADVHEFEAVVTHTTKPIIFIGYVPRGVELVFEMAAEVAQSFGLPTWGYAGCMDARILDAQAGLESGLTVLSQGLAGLNLIHDVGYMDNAMVCSAAQLVLGNEAIGWSKRFIRGVEVNSETIARDVIEAVGPGGHFLQQDHMVKHFRDELWRSDLLTRQSYVDWKAGGSKDMSQRIQEKLEDIIENHRVPSLPDKTVAALNRIKEKGEKELVARKA